MKIIGLNIQDFKRVVAVELAPTSGLNLIKGDNANGKSSCIDAISAALFGKGAIPSQPIRQGADSAEVVVDLGDFTVTRKFTPSGGSMQVTMKEGAVKASKPVAFLEEKLGRLAVDPLEFSRMKPPAQASLLREVAGIDTTTLDNEYDSVFNQRTEANRLAAYQEATLKNHPKPSAVPAEADILELESHLQELHEARSNAKAAESNRVRELEILDEKKRNLVTLESQVANLKAQILDLESTVSSSEPASPNEYDVHIEDAKTKLDHAREQNQTARQATVALAAHEKALADFTATSKKAKEMTAKLDGIKKQKAELLAAAKFPLPELGLAEDGTVTFNGNPFSQASSAESLRVGLALAFAVAKDIQVVLIKDGSVLDHENLKMVSEMANAAGVQVFLERVGCSVDGDPSGPTVGSFIIEDGGVQCPS